MGLRGGREAGSATLATPLWREAWDWDWDWDRLVKPRSDLLLPASARLGGCSVGLAKGSMRDKGWYGYYP